MGLAYRIDFGSPTAITNAATLLIQGVNAAGVAVKLHRIEIQSNQVGSTQSIIPLQLLTGTASGAGGTTPTASPIIRRNTVAAATTFRALSATMPTGTTILENWQWNGATPFDMVYGKDIIVPEFQAGTACWAIIIPSAVGTPTISGCLHFEEV